MSRLHKSLCLLLLSLICFSGESDKTELELKDNTYWSYVSDIIGLSFYEIGIVYKTGLKVYDRELGKIDNSRSIFLDGDIISAIKKDEEIYALARRGFIYKLRFQDSDFKIINVLNINDNAISFEVLDSKVIVSSISKVFIIDITDDEMSLLDSKHFEKPITSISGDRERVFLAFGIDSVTCLNLSDGSRKDFYTEDAVEILLYRDQTLFTNSFEKRISVFYINGDSLLFNGSLGSIYDYYSSFAYQDSVLYASILDKGFISWDLHKFPYETIETTYESNALSNKVIPNKRKIYLANGWQGFDIINIVGNDYYSSESKWAAKHSVMDVESGENGKFYVALGKGGIGIFDDDSLIFHYRTDGFCRDLTIDGEFITAAIEGEGVFSFIYDSLQGLTRTIGVPLEMPFSTGMDGKRMAFADMEKSKISFFRKMGLYNFDSAFDFKGIPREITIRDDLCAVSIDGYGVKLFRLDDEVKLLTEIRTPNSRGILFEDKMLLIADGIKGLMSYDISEPLTPELNWTVEIKGVSDIDANKDYFVVSTDTKAAVLLKRSDSKPEIIDDYTNSGMGTRIAINGNSVFSADQYSLYIFNIIEKY